MKTPQVLIVGAGPSGLVLANVLAQHGVDHLVIDRRQGPVEQSRAALIHVRTLELLDRLGVAERAVGQGIRLDRADFRQAGRRLASVRLSRRDGDTPYDAPLVLEQGATESLLIERLNELGGEVAWRHTLRKFDHGEAEIVGPDGAAETIRADWVVGADGGGSTVRSTLGVGFGGRTYQQRGLLADAELVFPTGADLDDETLRLDLTRGGFVGMFRLPSGSWRLFGTIPPKLAERIGDSSDQVSHEPFAAVPIEDLRWWLQEYFAAEAKLERVEWSALFRVHSRLADRFQVGNVFLVGDAAHLHTPAGGQGMNLGIGDAINLGWKLALVTTGRARPSLLASYESERRPVARKVLRGTDRGFALEATANPVAMWARNQLAARLLRPLLHLSWVQDAIFGLFSQTWIRYGRRPVLRSRDRLRPGDRAPYAGPGAGITRHVLLVTEGPARRQAEEIVKRFALDVAVQAVPAGSRQSALILIRPDGHVAAADLRTLAAYLAHFYSRRDA